MPKINQEEYEVLKDLDDKWKWIARNWSGFLHAYDTKPTKNIATSHWENFVGQTKRLDGKFQFIQWEDEDPYNIAELIEEYERYEIENIHVERKHPMFNCNRFNGFYNANIAIWNRLEEIVETEVKNIEWLKEEVEDNIEPYEEEDYLSYSAGCTDVAEFILELINQLDEPEVLSQEFIDEHAKAVAYDGMPDQTEVVYVDDLQNLLVPKQEVTEKQAYDKIAESFPATAKEIEAVLEKYYSSMLIEFSEELHESIMRAFDVEATSKTIEALTGMTLEQIAEEARNGGIVPKEPLGISQKLEKVQIPQFVADWIEEYIEYGYDLYPALKKMENNSRSWKKTYDWYRKNTHTFVNAYLTGKYEVEEEQKYYARIKGWENVTTGSEAFNWVYFKERDTVGISKAVENKYQAISFTKNDWNNLGINEDNADFILVEELEE